MGGKETNEKFFQTKEEKFNANMTNDFRVNIVRSAPVSMGFFFFS